MSLFCLALSLLCMPAVLRPPSFLISPSLFSPKEGKIGSQKAPKKDASFRFFLALPEGCFVAVVIRIVMAFRSLTLCKKYIADQDVGLDITNAFPALSTLTRPENYLVRITEFKLLPNIVKTTKL